MTPFTAASMAFTDTAAPRFMNIINLPNFVKDINSRLLQQDIFNKGTWDGNLFSAGMNQVLSNVGFSHHIGAKILGSVNHGLKQRLQCSIKRRERDEDTDSLEEMMTEAEPRTRDRCGDAARMWERRTEPSQCCDRPALWTQ